MPLPRLPNPPGIYEPPWANQYTREIERQLGQLDDSINNIIINNGAAVTVVDDLAALKALITRPEAVEMLGYSTPGDGGGGSFYWVAGSTATPDDGLVVEPTAGEAGRYIRLYSGGRNVRWFGATGDGVTDDAAAIQATIDSITTLSIGTVYIPEGVYSLGVDVTQNDRFVSFELDPGVEFIGTGHINGSLDRTVQRFSNRVFIGLPTDANDGREFWETIYKDWVETEVGSTTSTDDLVVISSVGFGAIIGASRTSDNPLEQSQGTRGVGSITIADKIGEFSAYTFYGESRRMGDAGWSHGAEIDMISRPGVVPGFEAITTPLLIPTSPFTDQALTGPWLSLGRPDVEDCGDVSVALAIINNAGDRDTEAGRARVGIMFDQKSILGEDGSYAGVTFGMAMALGQRHQIGWYNAASGNLPASFISMAAAVADATCIEIVDDGAIFRSRGGAWSTYIEQVASQDGPVHIAPGSAATPALLYVGTAAGPRDFEVSAYTGTVRLQGTKGITALSAYSATGHATAVQVRANAAGFAPFVEAIGPAGDLDLIVQGQSAGIVRTPNAFLIGETGGSPFLYFKDSAAGFDARVAVTGGTGTDGQGAVEWTCGIFGISSALFLGEYLWGQEVSAPSAPPADQYKMYAADNGAGKTGLYVRFPTGAPILIALEP